MTTRQDLSEGPRVTQVDSRNKYTIEPTHRRGFRRWLVLLVVLGGGLFFLASIFLANLCGAREPAQRIKCANNLRQIGLGAIMYASQNKDAFPATLEELAKFEDLGATVFYCPSDRTASPNPENGEAHSGFSYIYVGGGMKQTIDHPETAVIAYEPLNNHSNDGMKVHFESMADHSRDGMNVLFADAHVEWLPAPEGMTILKLFASGVRPIRYGDSNPTTMP